jgi:hypothetical protein
MSAAERNFEAALKREDLPGDYKFKRPGEHRAFKVREAARHARLAIITPNIPHERFSGVAFFKSWPEAMRWAGPECGKSPRIGVIPLGFSFIPA